VIAAAERAVVVEYDPADEGDARARAADGGRRRVVPPAAQRQMSAQRLKLLKRWVGRFWVFSPERLWLLSIALRTRGHWVLAFWVKQANALLYHNSLAPGASVGRDISLGHNSIGIVVTGNCVIGQRVKIWHNVTLSAGRHERVGSAEAAVSANGQPSTVGAATFVGPASQIIIEDGVTIGANAVVIAPRGRTLRIGRGARVGAGTVVTADVPVRGTVVGAPSRLLEREPTAKDSESTKENREPTSQ
jgi:serine O-acetyltransferase